MKYVIINYYCQCNKFKVMFENINFNSSLILIIMKNRSNINNKYISDFLKDELYDIYLDGLLC